MSPFNHEKMYSYINGFAHGAELENTQKALTFAREKHFGQLRKSGEPYIIHPLTMACNMISMGIREDAVIATILLHDVCEDCGVEVDELPVSEVVRNGVDLMTYRIMEEEAAEDAKKRYYKNLLTSREATLTKLVDRCHNVSSMAGTFSVEKMKKYITETREYVLPLLKSAKTQFPNDADILFILKYHIVSVIDAIEAMINAMETTKTPE